MKTGEELFVYGTLLPGERAHGLLKDLTSHLGTDEINGHLYHLGAYPGFKLIGAASENFNPHLPTVSGAAFYVKNSALGALLDGYEGYCAEAPETGLYTRQQMLTRKGRIVWVYIYNGYVSADQLIETGDWLNPRLTTTRRIPTIRTM